MGDYDRVLAARSKDRPTARELLMEIFSDFMEFHGDRRYGDDTAVVAGLARLNGMAVTVICTEKGRETQEKIARNFGSAHPEGYRKALRLMKQAEKFGRPVVCLVDTAGAFCDMEAEERGQGQAIAENLMEMMALRTPVLSVITGEGGSGGALGLAVADQVWMLQNAAYSVITPEGCASILWKDAGKREEAAQSLGLTAEKLLSLKVIDRIVPEEGGDFSRVAAALRQELYRTLVELRTLDEAELTRRRYQKYREMGVEQICWQS